MVFWLDRAHGIGVWVKVHTARWCNLTSPAKINNHCPESFFHLLGWWIHPSIKVDHMPIFYPVLWGYPVWSLRCHRNKKTSPCTGMQLHMWAVSCRTCQWPGAQSDPKMIPTHQNHLVQMKNKLPEQTWSATVQWWKLCHFRNLQAALLAKGLTRSYSFVEPPHQLEMMRTSQTYIQAGRWSSWSFLPLPSIEKILILWKCIRMLDGNGWPWHDRILLPRSELCVLPNHKPW